MKATIETGKMDIWLILPCPSVIYDPSIRSLEIGLYFLKFYLSLKIKIK